MSVEQFNQMFHRTTPPSPNDALPIITFTTDVTFHLNDDDIHVFHVAPAHTDGDAVVHFTKSNVIHTGDLFFSGFYPFIDLSSGGSVNGMIAASEKILSLCNAETKIIPGHGPLSDREGLKSFHDMLQIVRDRIKKLADAGKSLDEVKAEKPTSEFDERWGKGFMNADTFVEIVYRSVTMK
jgi:glyoxylase-like metal-dependent hydrolase (beta-lactamase superfamily II)